MATLTYSFYKKNSYGASAGYSDPYFTYDTVSYTGTVGQSTVSSISECKFSNANTNGSSGNGYQMDVEIMLNNSWYKIGHITVSGQLASHQTFSNFTSTATASVKSLMGKYAPGGGRLKAAKGYFHLNAGSTLSMTASMSLDYQTSSLTLDKSSVDGGATLTAAITMNSTALSHKFTWTFGTASFTSEAAAGVASHAVTIPTEWLNQIPSAKSGTASVTMQTYAGSTLIGSKSASFTVTVPASAAPTLGTFSVAGQNTYNNLSLKDFSNAKATLASASGKYGATISKVQITGNGESADAYSLTTGKLGTAGNMTFTVTAWDSRNYSTGKTAVLYVTDYSPPRITATEEFRCNSAGTRLKTGTYCSCKASWVISTLTGATATLTIGYKKNTGTWSPDNGYTGQPSSGSIHVIGAGKLTTDSGWTIVYTVSDGISSTTAQGRIASLDHFLHFRTGGQGLGIGTTCEADQRVQINDDWDLIVGGQSVKTAISGGGIETPISVAKGGTGATTAANALTNLGAAASGHKHGAGDITSGTLSIARGGTGATTAAAALTAIGAAASSHNHTAGNITSGTLAAARLPFKYAMGSTSVSGSNGATIDYSSAGFTAVPKVFVSYSTTGSNWTGDNGALKIHTKTKTGCIIIVGGSFSTMRNIDWFAIGT